MRIFALSSIFCLVTAGVRAEVPSEVHCDPEHPKRCSQPLVAGEKALFDGVLLSTELSINLGQKADSCEDIIKLEVDRILALSTNQKDLSEKLIKIERDATNARIQVLQNALESMKGLEKPPAWYERPPIVAAATALVVTGVYVLAIRTVEVAR